MGSGFCSGLSYRNVIDVALIVGEIRRGIDAGERAEIVDEVRLVEVSGFEGDVGPLDARAGGNLPEDLLETAEPTEQFWCQADFVAKNVDEVAGADADFIADRADFWSFGRRMKFIQSERDRGMSLGSAGCDGKQFTLEHLRFGSRRQGF